MSKGGGGGGYDPGPQYEYDKEKLIFDYEQAKDNYHRQQDAYEMQLWNRNQNLDFQDQERIEAWQHKQDMATYDFNNQVAARIASEEAVGKQLYYNELAEEIGINDATRQYNERLTSLGFQFEEVFQKLYDTEESAFFDKRGIRQNLFQEKKGLGLKKEGVGLSFKDMAGKAGLELEGLTTQRKGKQAELSAKAQKLGIDSMKAAGQAAAMGQTGRTARKNLQSIMASFGREQAILSDVLENSNSQYDQQFAQINQNVDASTRQTNLSYKQVAADIANAETNADFQIQKVGMQVSQAERGAARSERQLKESMKSAQDQLQSEKSALALQKFSADMSAEASLAPEPSMPPQPKPPVKLPRPKSMEPAAPPSWDRIPKPRRGTAGSSAGALSNFLGAAGTVAGIIGTVATVAPMLSDDRLKYNINKVGNSKKGIPIYTFKYRFDGKHGPTYKGTSAQDLIAMGREDAVVQKEKDGFYSVDYSKLDVDMEVVTT
tara:strand:+ start:759 stop:2231 length:1473 start_codon:yes stop_codon:yes gene_type:complete